LTDPKPGSALYPVPSVLMLAMVMEEVELPTEKVTVLPGREERVQDTGVQDVVLLDASHTLHPVRSLSPSL